MYISIGAPAVPLLHSQHVHATVSTATFTYDPELVMEYEKCHIMISSDLKGLMPAKCPSVSSGSIEIKVFPNTIYTALLRVSLSSWPQSYSDSRRIQFKTPGIWNTHFSLAYIVSFPIQPQSLVVMQSPIKAHVA